MRCARVPPLCPLSLGLNFVCSILLPLSVIVVYGHECVSWTRWHSAYFGYHHPSVQWPNTPMDERQRGNLAAAACQGGLGLLGFRSPANLAPWSFSPRLLRQRGTLYSACRIRACDKVGTPFFMGVDPLSAMRTPMKASWL